MSPQEVKLMLKLTALNKIIKIYHPLSNIHYDHYPEDGSYGEQRDDMVRTIYDELERDLKKLKDKTKNAEHIRK